MSGRFILRFALGGLLTAVLAAPVTAQQPPEAPMPHEKAGAGGVALGLSFGTVQVKVLEAEYPVPVAANDQQQLFNFYVGLFGANEPTMPQPNPPAPTLSDPPLPPGPPPASIFDEWVAPGVRAADLAVKATQPCPACPMAAPNPLLGTWYRDLGEAVISVTFTRDEMKLCMSQHEDGTLVTLVLTAHYTLTNDGLVYGAITGADVDLKQEGKAGKGMELAELSLALQELADRPFSFRTKATSAGLMVSQLKAVSFEGLGGKDLLVLGGLYKSAKGGKVPAPAQVKTVQVGGKCDSGYNPADCPAGPVGPYRPVAGAAIGGGAVGAALGTAVGAPVGPALGALVGSAADRYEARPPSVTVGEPVPRFGFSTEYSDTPLMPAPREPVQRYGVDFSTNPPTMSLPACPAPARPACTDPMKSMAADAFGQMLLAGDKRPGCGGMTLPSPQYLQHNPQYFAPDPAFPLPRELAAQEDPAGVVRRAGAVTPAGSQPPAALGVTKPGIVGTWFREIGARQCLVKVAADHLTVTVSEAREIDGKTGTAHFTLTADYQFTRDGLTAVGLITSVDMKFDGDLLDSDAEGLLEHLGAMQKALEDKPFAMTFRVYGDVLVIGNVRLPAVGEQLDTEPGAYIGGRYKVAGDKPLPKLKAVKCQPQPLPVCVPPVPLGAPNAYSGPAFGPGAYGPPPGAIYNGPALIGGPFGPGVGSAGPPPGVYVPPGLVFPPGSSYPQPAPSGDLLPPQTLPCPTAPCPNPSPARPVSGWVVPSQPLRIEVEVPPVMNEPVAPEPTMPAPIPPALSAESKPVPATEMQVAWRNRIAYLPDPTRNGAMRPGIAGQMFLYGGPKLEFALADGTLTVDLIDETPRPAGQPAARPERWQFDKNTLRNLKTTDETFGKSYVLFLPWSGYSADVTKVKLTVRYDPDNGHTLYSAPMTLTIAPKEESKPVMPAPIPPAVSANEVKGLPLAIDLGVPVVRKGSFLHELGTHTQPQQLFNFGIGLFGSQ